MDSQVLEILKRESQRQKEGLELIASENYASAEVMRLQGSIFTNKYAEGYPKKRYYGGCEFVDEVEELAQLRVCQLFSAQFANVQPHSGSGANMAVYEALLQKGDTVLGMNLSQGGHLTHGSPASFSGQHYRVIPYGLNEEEILDYDAMRNLALEHKPKMIIAGASAYSQILDFAKFREVADEVGAILLVDMAHIAGLVAAGLHPNPVGVAHVVTSTTHKTLRGPRGGLILTNDEEMIQKINKAIFPGIQGGPLMHVIAAKAVAFFEALKPEFVTYQKAVLENASVLAQELAQYGLRPVSGGTQNHLALIDLSALDISGKKAEAVLQSVHITVNKNTIPKETRSPFITSGIRVGTPAITTRGMKKEHMAQVAKWMFEAISSIKNESRLTEIANEVSGFANQFPIPGQE